MSASSTWLWRAAFTLLLFSMLTPLYPASPLPLPLLQRSPEQLNFAIADSHNPPSSPEREHGHSPNAAKRVNVTLGVMSRCPDALACEAVFDKVLQRVNTKTHLSMTYIGTLSNHTNNSRYGVNCMHGDDECLANIQQLCVQDALNPRRAAHDFGLSPSAAQKMWWSFIQCQNFAGIPTIGSEQLARRCLKLIHGPDWDNDGIADCINRNKGRELFKHSVANTRHLNITKSCTILIEGGHHCVRDGGVWKECTIGHQISDFVTAIERVWQTKNNNPNQNLDSIERVWQTEDNNPNQNLDAIERVWQTKDNIPDQNLDAISPQLASTTRLTPPFLIKRQQLPPPSNTDQSNTNGVFGSPSRTPPSVFTLIIAIALFVLVVTFVLLRIVIRNRRLRRLGLLSEGPMDRLVGNARQIEDTLVPPQLWEAKIAHEWAPSKSDSDVRQKGWDAVMPVSAALPPNLYGELFLDDVGSKVKTDTNGSAPSPASHQPRPNVISRHMLPFLKRGETAVSTAEPVQALQDADGESDDATAEKLKALESVSASVNVTVLIAMPSPRTVFPHSSTAQLRRNASGSKSLKNQGITTFPPLTRVQSTRLDGVEEDTDEDKTRLRRASSVKSFRTVASTKSMAEARREAFFGAMNMYPASDKAAGAEPAWLDRDISGEADATGSVGGGGGGGDGIHTYGDDEEEDELPELVFGTASVPIYCREASLNRSTETPVVPRQLFSGMSGTFHPTRSELVELVNSAHMARERKARDEAAMKAAQDKEAASGEDGHTIMDDQSQANARNGSGTTQGGMGRQSASETIDSDVGGIQLTAISSTRQDGLGDVVSRMMSSRSSDSPIPGASLDSGRRPSNLVGNGGENEGRPSVGFGSVTSNDQVDTRATTPLPPRGVNGSSLTLDPLLGEASRSSITASRSITGHPVP